MELEMTAVINLTLQGQEDFAAMKTILEEIDVEEVAKKIGHDAFQKFYALWSQLYSAVGMDL